MPQYAGQRDVGPCGARDRPPPSVRRSPATCPSCHRCTGDASFIHKVDRGLVNAGMNHGSFGEIVLSMSRTGGGATVPASCEAWPAAGCAGGARKAPLDLVRPDPEVHLFRGFDQVVSLLGQTIPLGTFMFDTPLGISSLDARIGDAAWTYNWDVTHVPSGIHISWGYAQARLDRIETNLTVLNSTYDSVIVISVLFGRGEGQYYLEKGIGIVKVTAKGSPFFTLRELVKFVPPPTAVVSNNWKKYANRREVRVISDVYGEAVKISMPVYGSIVEAKIFSLDGRIIAKDRYVNKTDSELRLQGKLKPGCYVLQVRDGASYQSRSFSVSR